MPVVSRPLTTILATLRQLSLEKETFRLALARKIIAVPHGTLQQAHALDQGSSATIIFASGAGLGQEGV